MRFLSFIRDSGDHTVMRKKVLDLLFERLIKMKFSTYKE